MYIETCRIEDYIERKYCDISISVSVRVRVCVRACVRARAHVLVDCNINHIKMHGTCIKINKPMFLTSV